MLSFLALFACSAPPLVDAPPAEFVEHGRDLGAGNIVGIQAWVDPTAYHSAERLQDRLDVWMLDARAEGWLRDDTVVVLPESIGTWLVLLGEPARVLEAPDAATALERLVKRHPAAFLQHRADAPVDDERYALFSMKSRDMARAYQQVMSDLAATYGVTLVAGTILLPEPEIIDGSLEVFPGGQLYDVSLVFGPDGAMILEPLEELYPDAAEADLVTPGRLTSVQAFDLPHAQLAVLPGEDAWFPEAWDAVSAGGARPWVVAPQYVSPDRVWMDPWRGYDGWEEPVDVDPKDLYSLTLAEADAVYGMPGRLQDQGLPGGIAVPLRGHLWDLGSDGVVRMGLGGDWVDGPQVDAPVVANLWLTDTSGSHD